MALSFKGKNINEEAARVIQDGMDECELWGDLDIQALLMVQAAELEAQRGKKDDSMAVLQVITTALFALYSDILKNVGEAWECPYCPCLDPGMMIFHCCCDLYVICV